MIGGAWQRVDLQMSAFSSCLDYYSYLAYISSDVPALLGVLRLSNKFDVPKLKLRALTHLEAHYPKDPLRHVTAPPSTAFPLLLPSPDHIHLSITAANIARETNTLTLLSPVLFACCSINPQSLVKTWQTHNHDNSSPPSGLTPENLYAVLKARNEITLFTRRHVFGSAFTSMDVPGCQTPEVCRRVRGEWAEAVEKDAEGREGWIDPLSPGSLLAKLARSACVKCLERGKSDFLVGRRVLWERLPEIIGLSEWGRSEKRSSEGSP